MYGFKLDDPLSAIANSAQDDIPDLRTMHRAEATHAIAWANAQAKSRYNKVHKAMHLKKGDSVYLRPHRGYTIPGERSKKLSNQRCGPFKILDN